MSIPSNIVIMWSGAIIEIPNGWFLCDGTNGTPDLKNRFVVGSGSIYGLDSTGGSANSIVPSHTHTLSGDTAPNHTHSLTTLRHLTYPSPDNYQFGHWSLGNGNAANTTFASGGDHSHSFNSNTLGESGINKNLPPYLALAYIMYGGN